MQNEQAVNIDFSKGLGVKDMLQPEISKAKEIVKASADVFYKNFKDVWEHSDRHAGTVLMTAGVMEGFATAWLAIAGHPELAIPAGATSLITAELGRRLIVSDLQRSEALKTVN